MYSKKRVLLTVKAYPEISQKHGESVCTAGITEDGEWIRMYPLPLMTFRKNPIPRYSWIEVECTKVTERIFNRKESYKIHPETIKIVDDSLTKSPVNWKARNSIILALLSKSIEELKENFDKDKTSLGLIKPKKVIEFFQTGEMTEHEKEINLDIQKTIFGEKYPVLEKLPHMFHYKFLCEAEGCRGHDMTCEDWELFQSFRSWRCKYTDHKTLWEKLYYKYYTYFTEKRDLYFYMGTHSRYKVWMIIGLYYPPKKI